MMMDMEMEMDGMGMDMDGNDDLNMKYKPMKVCGICGDKALGYNFNAVTCEACKAFFRRNALRTKDFKCPFDGNCKIDLVTRRFCQKCRLKKCFDIGMKKEWILSEEEKKVKRDKIMENRKKKDSITGTTYNGDPYSSSSETYSPEIKSSMNCLNSDLLNSNYSLSMSEGKFINSIYLLDQYQNYLNGKSCPKVDSVVPQQQPSVLPPPQSISPYSPSSIGSNVKVPNLNHTEPVNNNGKSNETLLRSPPPNHQTQPQPQPTHHHHQPTPPPTPSIPNTLNDRSNMLDHANQYSNMYHKLGSESLKSFDYGGSFSHDQYRHSLHQALQRTVAAAAAVNHHHHHHPHHPPPPLPPSHHHNPQPHSHIPHPQSQHHVNGNAHHSTNKLSESDRVPTIPPPTPQSLHHRQQPPPPPSSSSLPPTSPQHISNNSSQPNTHHQPLASSVHSPHIPIPIPSHHNHPHHPTTTATQRHMSNSFYPKPLFEIKKEPTGTGESVINTTLDPHSSNSNDSNSNHSYYPYYQHSKTRTSESASTVKSTPFSAIGHDPITTASLTTNEKTEHLKRLNNGTRTSVNSIPTPNVYHPHAHVPHSLVHSASTPLASTLHQNVSPLSHHLNPSSHNHQHHNLHKSTTNGSDRHRHVSIEHDIRSPLGSNGYDISDDDETVPQPKRASLTSSNASHHSINNNNNPHHHQQHRNDLREDGNVTSHNVSNDSMQLLLSSKVDLNNTKPEMIKTLETTTADTDTAISTPSSSPSSYNFIEQLRVQELTFACGLLEHWTQRNGNMMLIRDIIELKEMSTALELIIEKMIKMAMKVTTFNELCKEEKSSILKNSIVEMVILRTVLNYSPEKDSWVFNLDERGFNSDHCQKLNYGTTESVSYKTSNYDEIRQFMLAFEQEWKNDQTLFDLLTMIVLFTPSGQNLKHREIIKLEYLTYRHLLKKHLESKIKSKEMSRNHFINLMDLLEQLHRINEKVNKVYTFELIDRLLI